VDQCGASRVAQRIQVSLAGSKKPGQTGLSGAM